MRRAWPWAVWAGGTLAGFAAIETAALRHHRWPTLTAVLRYLLGIDPAHERRTIRAAAAIGGLTGGLVALAVHLHHSPERP